MKVLVKGAVLPLITLAAVSVYGYVQNFVQIAVFKMASPRTYQDMVICALAGAAAAAVVVSIPIAWTFRKMVLPASVIVSLPILALRINEFLTYTGPLYHQVKVMAVVESASYLVFLVFGTLIASRIRQRSNNSFKPRPLRGSA